MFFKFSRAKNMTYLQKIKYIGQHGVLRLEMWRDPKDNGAWRGGVNWYGEDNFDFVCEKLTMEGVIDCILANKKEWIKSRRQNK